jgi:hypothetical protein
MSRCKHGTYHLSVRGVTLHLSAADVRHLAHLMFTLICHHADEIDAGATEDKRRKIWYNHFRNEWN